MFWRLLQVYWLVSILDLTSIASGERDTLKLKTKNNGKIDPYSFEVFPTSRQENFGKFSENIYNENQEDDPDMALFFKDFFNDDSTFYQSTFTKNNNNIKDFFTENLEESRKRYMEDVNNIDKMFKKPVRSSIDDLLKEDVPMQTTHNETSSKNLNSSERTSLLNTNNERNEHHTTKRSVDIQKANGSNTLISATNTVNIENPVVMKNKSLFLEVHKAAGSNLVNKLVPVTGKDITNVDKKALDKDEKRVPRGSDNSEELLDSQNLKSENSILNSLNVVTEISVQEIVDGKTIQRKPSIEELRLIENKILGLSLQNTSEKVPQRSSYQVEDYDEVNPNDDVSNHPSKTKDRQDRVQQNEVIEDLSTLLKVDPNFEDEEMDKLLTDDEDLRDMGSIFSDKDDEYETLKREQSTKDKETSNNIFPNIQSNDTNHKSQGNEDNNIGGSEEGQKNKNSLINGDREDPRNYRKIFHTEHKNLSNVSDVKITFSETEGDFLDDDDSEYALNITENPETVNEENVLVNKESVITEMPSSPVPEIITEYEEIDKNIGVNDENIDSDEATSILNRSDHFSTFSPEIEESENTPNYYIKPNLYSTDLPFTTDVTTENVPSFTEKEEILTENKGSLKMSVENESSLESNIPENKLTALKDSTEAISVTESVDSENLTTIEEKIAISSQNINSTMHSKESVTEMYEDFEDIISFKPDLFSTSVNKSEEIDSIDRTFALIKQILSMSENDPATEKSIDDAVPTTIVNDNYFHVEDSSDLPNIKETITIPLDTSTVPINLINSTEEFIQTTNDFKDLDIATQLYKKDVEEEISSTESNIDISTVFKIMTTTEVDTTEKKLAETSESPNSTPGSYDTETRYLKVINTDSPNAVAFKETEVKPHELSSSEVESIYNAKIEEYESLEDNSYDSGENVDGWTIFGDKSKKSHSKINKKEGPKDRQGSNAEKSKHNNSEDILKEQKRDDKKTANNVDHFEELDSYSTVNDNGYSVYLVPILSGTILNNTAKFSIKISKKDETFFVPSSAHIEESGNTINITWKTNDYLNNSIALKLFENEEFYTIKEIMINLLTGNMFVKQKKLVAFNPDPLLDDSIIGKNRVAMMRDGTYIFFSNVDFLKKNYIPLGKTREYSEASMRERRIWHIEIASICLAVVALIAVVLYIVAIKTRRKITLREKNELAQVTHC